MRYKLHNIIRNILLAISISICGVTVIANEPLAGGDFVTELHTPEIPKKQIGSVCSYMERQLKSFPKLANAKVEMTDDYIIKYTIPVSELFEPNGFNFMSQSTEYLSPILPFLRHHGKYKVILAMHTDDTGSNDYRKILCDNRILSLYDFFDSKIGTQALVYGFSLSDSAPIHPNNSFKFRAENRRLEIYIVPGPTFMDNFKLKK